MKKLILLLFGVIFGLSMNAQTSAVPNEFVFYDTTTGAPFTYDNTLNTGLDVYSFICGIAYDVSYSGNHLKFSISNEDFKWQVMRRTTENYVDFYVDLFLGYYSGVIPGFTGNTPYCQTYIIRVQFNR